MNKAELIALVAENAGLSKKDTEKAVNSLIDTITDTLKGGDKVQLVGFGVFEVKQRAARMGRNPKTKEQISIPASSVPVFKAGKAFKDAIDK
ncbi:MAG: HU family DNA-binding protein [Oscillospiraceae bacterium]|nr:HU family DNA-binding protein [Oscillospiraceae bacterium]